MKNEGLQAKQTDAIVKIAIIILAAGQSSRMGTANKLLEPVQGKPMLRHALDAAIESKASAIIVVTGFEAKQIDALLKGLPVAVVHNPFYAQGISSSLRCGIAALPADIDGVVICLADMPGVGACHIDKLIEAFDPQRNRAICVSSFGGRRGNPVLWSRLFFNEMQQLSGDAGARQLMQLHAALIHAVDMPSDAVLRDIDTPDALADLNRRYR